MNNMKQLLRTIALKLLDYTEPDYLSFEEKTGGVCKFCGNDELVYNIKLDNVKCLNCNKFQECNPAPFPLYKRF